MYLVKKSPKFFPAGPFFLVLQLNVYWSALILRNLPCPKKFLVTRLLLQDDITQPILVWKYSVTTLWGFNQWNLAKKIQNGTSNFLIFVKHDSPRQRKNLVFQLGLSIVLKKPLKFLNLLYICITVLGWPCLSTNSWNNKAEGCLNVSFSLYKCFQEFTFTAASCFDQLSFFCRFSFFFLTFN